GPWRGHYFRKVRFQHMSEQIEQVRSSGKVPLCIDGEFVSSQSGEWVELSNPARQATIAQVPVATADEMERAIASAKEAQRSWRHVPVVRRVRYLLKYQELLKQNQAKIAKVLAEETGKTEGDAMGDVWRGIEVVEHACSLPT